MASISPSNPWPSHSTFGFIGMSRLDVFGQHQQPLLTGIVQAQVHLPPRLELLWLLLLEVAKAVIVPQLICVLD